MAQKYIALIESLPGQGKTTIAMKFYTQMQDKLVGGFTLIPVYQYQNKEYQLCGYDAYRFRTQECLPIARTHRNEWDVKEELRPGQFFYLNAENIEKLIYLTIEENERENLDALIIDDISLITAARSLRSRGEEQSLIVYLFLKILKNPKQVNIINIARSRIWDVMRCRRIIESHPSHIIDVIKVRQLTKVNFRYLAETIWHETTDRDQPINMC